MNEYIPSEDELKRAENMMPEELKSEREKEVWQQWEVWKDGDYYAAGLRKALAENFDDETRNKFAESALQEEIAKGNFGFVLRFRKNLANGELVSRIPGAADDEIISLANQKYQEAMDMGDYDQAMWIAEGVGDEEKRQVAEKLHSTNLKREILEREAEEGGDKEKEFYVEIEPNETLKSFFSRIQKDPNLFEFEEQFWAEVHKRFSSDITENIQTAKNLGTGFVDFFLQNGISENDIETFLPIKIKKPDAT